MNQVPKHSAALPSLLLEVDLSRELRERKKNGVVFLFFFYSLISTSHAFQDTFDTFDGFLQ